MTDAVVRVENPQPLRCGTMDRLGEHCSSGCRTKAHRSYAECLKDKGTTTYLAAPSRGLDGSKQKRWDAELSRYRAARKEGIQPEGTTMAKVVEAQRLSDEKGAAFGRDFSKATPLEMY